MISEISYKLNEDLTKEELETLVFFLKKTVEVLPKRAIASSFDNNTSDLKYTVDFHIVDDYLKSTIEIGSKDDTEKEPFIFTPMKTESIEHYNHGCLSYEFILKTFLLTLKAIAPSKVVIFDNYGIWDDVVLFTFSLLQNTEQEFTETEFIDNEITLVQNRRLDDYV